MKGENTIEQVESERNKIAKYFVEHGLSLNKILSIIFNKRIRRIKYLEDCKLKQMPEYKFNLAKFNIVLDDWSNHTMFIRLIDYYKVKESLFCYWLFCEENYSLKTRFFDTKANIVNLEMQKYEKRYEMQLLDRKKQIWKNSFVDIINLRKYNKLENLSIIRKTNIDKYLFIAII